MIDATSRSAGIRVDAGNERTFERIVALRSVCFAAVVYAGAHVCLGVPGEVVELWTDADVLMGRVDFGGVRRTVCLDHVRDVKAGEFVLVHVGFALTRIDAEEARRVFALLAELGELEDA